MSLRGAPGERVHGCDRCGDTVRLHYVTRALQNVECFAAGGVGAAELAGMRVTVEGSGYGDTPHERHCQVACSEVQRRRLRLRCTDGGVEW